MDEEGGGEGKGMFMHDLQCLLPSHLIYQT